MIQRSNDPPRDGEQLRLDLFQREPWDGQCPRVLTRRFIPLFLRQEPPSHEVFFDADQYDLWRPIGHTEKKAPLRRSSRGAPSLLPLKKRRQKRGVPLWLDEEE